MRLPESARLGKEGRACKCGVSLGSGRIDDRGAREALHGCTTKSVAHRMAKSSSEESWGAGRLAVSAGLGCSLVSIVCDTVWRNGKTSWCRRGVSRMIGGVLEGGLVVQCCV